MSVAFGVSEIVSPVAREHTFTRVEAIWSKLIDKVMRHKFECEITLRLCNNFQRLVQCTFN